jgi:hypothetical protein
MLDTLLQVVPEFSLGDGIAIVAIASSFLTWLLYYRRKFPSETATELSQLRKQFEDHVKEEDVRMSNMNVKMVKIDGKLDVITNDTSWIKESLNRIENGKHIP